MYLASESWTVLHWLSLDETAEADSQPGRGYEVYAFIGRPQKAGRDQGGLPPRLSLASSAAALQSLLDSVLANRRQAGALR